MAVDECLFRLCADGEIGGALRFYEWEPHAVSLGYSQTPDLLDREECARRGIDVVKRVTGGGAILHAEELTYCIVMRRGRGRGAARPSVFAAAVGASLCSGLERLGVRASANVRRGSRGRGQGRGAGQPELCFASGVENEVEVSGKKLAGCAHKVSREVLFSHGSVIMGPGHLAVAQLLRSEIRGRLEHALEDSSTCFEKLLGSRPEPGTAERAFREAFESVFCLSFEAALLPPAQQELVKDAVRRKRAEGSPASRREGAE